MVDVWTTESDLPAIKAAGQDALISYGAYLDRQNPANGSHWMFIATWCVPRLLASSPKSAALTPTTATRCPPRHPATTGKTCTRT